MTFEEIKNIITAKLGEDVVTSQNAEATQPYLVIDHSKIADVCTLLHGHEQLYFDHLSCLSGVDYGEEKGLLGVVYHLYSIPFDLHIVLKTELDRSLEKPSIPSVTKIWAGANWHEREAYDLLGIFFEGHPDLRRILMPADWEGHPLRKDYKEQEKYHGIKVEY